MCSEGGSQHLIGPRLLAFNFKLDMFKTLISVDFKFKFIE